MKNPVMDSQKRAEAYGRVYPRPDQFMGFEGSEIRGSIYVRNYCWFCGTAMRVLGASIGHPVYCEECEGRHDRSAGLHLTKRMKYGNMKTGVSDDCL